MAQQSNLERPELFKSFRFRWWAHRIEKALLLAGKAAEVSDYQPNITVVVRTKNDFTSLRKIIDHLNKERQSYRGRIDLVVVDTESTDGTSELAQEAGATVAKMKQMNFNYPKGINLGLEKAKNDVEIAFITVGHAQPALSNCLQAGARHFNDQKVVGVYADLVPNDNASFWEQVLYLLSPNIQRRMAAGAHKTPKLHIGAMQATGCMVRLSAWREHKFDEAYGHGGEDYIWAAWALSRGYGLICDPAVAVHHSHGLGLVNLLREIKYWITVIRTPGEFDHKKLTKHRPDLRL